MKKFMEYIRKHQNLIIYFLITLFAASMHSFDKNNDNYWLLKLGEYVFYNNIPAVDPLTYHKDLAFIAHQWLSVLSFYTLSNFLSGYLLDLFMIILMAATGVCIYKFAIVIGKNSIVHSSTITIVTMIILDKYYVLRPMMISLLIIFGVFFILEKYKFNHSTKVIYLIPLLSLLLVNFHGAVWILLFLIMIPYIIETPKDIKIWTILFISVLIGLMNPNGIKVLFYYYYANTGGSYGVNFNSEMMLPDFKKMFAVVFGLSIIAILGILKRTEKTLDKRHILLLIGLIFMAFVSDRNIFLYAPIGISIAGIYLKHKNLPHYLEKYKILLSVAIFSVIIINSFLPMSRAQVDVEKNDSKILNDVVDYMDRKLVKKDLKVFNQGPYGGYLQHRGYKPFIDSRWEVFSKAMNKKDDILEDYFNCFTGKTFYRDVFDKYEVTHVLWMNDDFLTDHFKRDSHLTLLIKGRKFSLYEYKGED